MTAKHWAWIVLTLVVIAGTFVVLGMTSPRTVPRLGILPAPEGRTLANECETWEREGIFWRALYSGPRAGRPCNQG